MEIIFQDKSLLFVEKRVEDGDNPVQTVYGPFWINILQYVKMMLLFSYSYDCTFIQIQTCMHCKGVFNIFFLVTMYQNIFRGVFQFKHLDLSNILLFLTASGQDDWKLFFSILTIQESAFEGRWENMSLTVSSTWQRLKISLCSLLQYSSVTWFTIWNLPLDLQKTAQFSPLLQIQSSVYSLPLDARLVS